LDFKKKDYRDRQEGYRAIHFIINENKKSIELQSRTLVQHLWAEESESFGEKTKEDGGSGKVKEYLEDLSKICYKMENSLNIESKTHTELFKKRTPIQGKLPKLLQNFKNSSTAKHSKPSSVIVVFDNSTRELIQSFSFSEKERVEALNHYQILSDQLPQDRFDIVILNTCNDNSPKVTHSRFYL